MIFLTAKDIRTVIRDEILELITEIVQIDEDLEPDDVQDKAEGSAISKMKSFLSKRFNVTKIFDPDEDYQDKELIIEYCVDIMLHRLHARVNPRKIPDIRRERYAEAMDWLEGVATGDLNPTLPELEPDADGNDISSEAVRFGGGINESNWRY